MPIVIRARHPNLAHHDALGLATDTELTAQAAAEAVVDAALTAGLATKETPAGAQAKAAAAQAAAIAASIPLVQKGAASGVATLDSGGLLTLAQLPPIPAATYFARRGTIDIMGCGDSLTARGLLLARPGFDTEFAILLWAQMASMGKIRFIGQSALGGLLAAQIRTVCVPGVIAATRKPTHCLVLAGVNDIWIAGGYGSDLPSTYVAISGIYDDLLAANIIPVAATIPGFMTSGIHPANLLRVNDHVRRTAEQLGLPLADFFEVCSDPAIDPSVSALRGTWRTNYLLQSSSDAVHPGGIGCQAMGAHLATVLVPQGATAAELPMYNNDGVNKITNGLMVTDANANSIPDSWTATAVGTGVTHSLVTDAAIRGQWWRVVKTVSDSTSYQQTAIAAIAGQVVRFVANVKINSIGASPGRFRAYLLDNLGNVLNDPNTVPRDASMVSASQSTTLPSAVWIERSADGGTLTGQGLLMAEGVVAGAATSVNLTLEWYGPCDVQVAQVAVTVLPYGVAGPAPTVPGAPTIGTATAGNTQATGTWTAGSSGGSAITGYQIKTLKASDNSVLFTDTTGAVLTFTRTGLTNGVGVYFKVAAINAVGTGAQSAASNSVTPAVTTVPGAPTSVVGTPGDTTASIAFTPPGSNGGSAITGYTATLTPGGASFSAASSPISATGLTNGTAYTATVHATNANGNSVESTASAPFTPAVPPFTPASLSDLKWWGEDLPALADNASVTSWTDLGPAGNHLTDPTAGALTPVNKTAILDGKSVVRFTSDFLQKLFSLPQPYTVVVVSKSNRTSDSPVFQVLFDGPNAATGEFRVLGGVVQAQAGATLSGPSADTGWHIWAITFNGASSVIRRDGGAGTSGNTGTNAPGGLTIGARANSTCWWDGDVYGGVVVAHAMTPTELNNTLAYFKAKAPTTLPTQTTVP